MWFNDIDIRTQYPDVFHERHRARLAQLDRAAALPGTRRGAGGVLDFAQTCLKGLRNRANRPMKRASKRWLQP